jgi:trigger factor
MAAELERKEDSVVVLTIDVAPEVFGEALQRSFRKNANQFMIPGFRKGKAPMNIVTKYYGEGVLYEDAIDYAANPAYMEAVKEYDLEPVSQPEIDILDIGREKGMKFTVSVTVKPATTLGQYLGVEAQKPSFPVTDEDVEAEVTRVRERNGRTVTVEDRPVQDGDTVNIDYEGFVDDVAFDGGKAEGHDLKIGSSSFIPGFEEQLVGHETGESFSINVTFPEEYSSEDLAGKDARFDVTINSINVTELPDLDDEFAKDVSEFDTLAEYRDDLRKKQEESAAERTSQIFEENVIRAVVANAEVDIPQVMVDHEVEHMVQEQNMQMRYQGFELEQFLSYTGQTMDTFKEQLQEPAKQQVRTRLVLEQVSKDAQVEPTEEEVEAEIEKMAATYNMPAEEIKKQLGDGEDNMAKDQVVRQKTIALLVDSAVAVDPPEPVEETTEENEETEKTDPEQES